MDVDWQNSGGIVALGLLGIALVLTLRYMRKRQHRLRSSPTSGSADAPVDVRVTGGTLNGDGYRPTAES